MMRNFDATAPIDLSGRLKVANVSKSYRTPTDTVHALDHVTLDIEAGEFVCLVGASGCGKSTLLDIVAGLTKADEGEVLADGQSVDGPGRQRLVMFQESALFPRLNVMGNVMFGLKLCPEFDDAERKKIANRFRKLVGLERFARASVHELSGGMKQRVALARALAPGPRVLLLDEPFASLDAMTREQLYADMQDIWQSHRKTILLVTNNVREAVCLADRVVLMSPSPGRIRQEFRIDLSRPRDINDPALSAHAQTITRALKQYQSSQANSSEVHE